MIYSGKLTEYLAFYKVEEVQSESGFKHPVETFMFKVRAERLKNKENYVVDADELFHSNELRFRIRYRKEIEEKGLSCQAESDNHCEALRKSAAQSLRQLPE